MFRGFIWDQKLYTAIVTAMTLHYIIDRWRTMTRSNKEVRTKVKVDTSSVGNGTFGGI